MMRKLFILCLLLTTACSTSTPNPVITSPTPQPDIQSGIEGTVTIGPMCPVVRIDQPCPDEPYQAELTVLDTSGNKVTSIQSDAEGKFRIVLAPGDYILHPESPGAMPYAGDIPITVEEGIFSTVDVVYDSGIR